MRVCVVSSGRSGSGSDALCLVVWTATKNDNQDAAAGRGKARVFVETHLGCKCEDKRSEPRGDGDDLRGVQCE